MIRMNKRAAARLGFGGTNTDRHTADRLHKKTLNRAKGYSQKGEPKNPRPKKEKTECCRLVKASGSRYALDMDDLE